MAKEKVKDNKTTFRSVFASLMRLYSLTTEHFKWALLRMLGGVASASLGVFSSWLLGNVVDVSIEVSKSGDMSKYTRFAIMIGLFFIARGVVNYINPLTGRRYSLYSGRKIRSLAVDKLNKLPINYFENTHSGEVISRLANDIDTLQDFYGNSVAGIWSFIPTMLIASIWILVKINPLLTLLCCSVIPLVWYVVKKIAIPIGDASKKRQEYIAEYNSYLRDFLEGVHIYISYNMKKIFYKKFDYACLNAYKQSLEISKRRARSISVNISSFILPQIIAYGIGGVFVVKGEMTVGQLIIFANVIFPFLNSMQQLIHTWNDWLIHTGKANHLFELLDAKSERDDGADYSNEKTENVVTFSNVKFAYNEKIPVFTELSFSLNKYQKVAFVGSSGSGKTTLFKMILGYYDNYEGDISFLNHNINNWKLNDLRKNISVVNQEVYLFNDNIMENIRMGNINASDEEVKQAAREAYAEDFILASKDGYLTMVGERGGSLSGGQRQRIAIARAILKDAPILLLDEPTSALDTKAEYYVQKAIEKLEQGKTVLVIAHRLSTIENADKILVIEGGTIVEEGTHKELVAKKGRYIELYQHQINEQRRGSINEK